MASLSLRDRRGRIRPPTRWRPRLRARAVAVVKDALRGAGDPARERCFITLSDMALALQRAVSDAEMARLPNDFRSFQAVDPAGEPLQVLWERGRVL